MNNMEQLIRTCAQTQEDKWLIAQLLEKYTVSQERCYLTYTHFLDLRERTLCMRVAQQAGISSRIVFWGGYEDAERVVALCLPDYLNAQDAIRAAYSPLALLRVEKSPSDRLHHRDYLGALMALGVKRTVLGDIVLQPHGADLFVMADMAQFIQMNFLRAGKKRVQTAQVSFEMFHSPQVEEQVGEGTVSSLRLDSVSALIFRISRAQMQGQIEKGTVFLNQIQCTKPDAEVGLHDRITVRGAGRARILELGGVSRKGRQFVRYTRSV